LARKSFKTKPLIKPTVLEDDQLQNLKIPVLYLVGENEILYSAKEALERLYRIAPQIKAEFIPNSGHDICSAQTEIVNRKILEFLNHK
jgi:pimeloyl-ACP methyl ester carboxylesterase